LKKERRIWVIENKKNWSPMGKIEIKIYFFLTPPGA
jgi:hypothetical protein